MGWHAYLDDHLGFPFRARCTTERATSTLNVGDVVDVVSMAPADECEHEMFVMIPRGRRRLAIPLAQIEGEDADPETRQAIDDWRYWVARGYEL